jgi:hypothetical protein
MKKKVDVRLKKLILSQHKKYPGLGVRKLADLLGEKHGISLSKSTIHALLKSSGKKLKKGPKKAKLAYRKTSLAEGGLILLRCIDNQIGFFDYLAESLNVYFPKLKKELLKKFIILASLASLSAQKLEKEVCKKSFLCLSGLDRFPVKKFDYFKRQINRYQPTVELQPLNKNLAIVVGIKIVFLDGSYVFSDPQLATLWDSLPQTDYFFDSIKNCRDKIKRMLDEKLLIIGYTKSFDYVSALVFELIRGLKKEVKEIQLFDKKSKLIEKIEVNKKVEAVLGYYPKGISKGIRFTKKKKYYRRSHIEQLGSFYLMNIYSEFIQHFGKQRIVLSNVLINRKNYGLPNWGLISSADKLSRLKANHIFKSYIYLWPEMEENLFRGTKEIEKSFLIQESQKNEIISTMPHKLVFSKLNSFGRVGQLLSVMFKEFVEGVEPKRKIGFLEKGKDYIVVVLSNLAVKTKKRLDQQAFFLDKKRVFFR